MSRGRLTRRLLTLQPTVSEPSMLEIVFWRRGEKALHLRTRLDLFVGVLSALTGSVATTAIEVYLHVAH